MNLNKALLSFVVGIYLVVLAGCHSTTTTESHHVSPSQVYQTYSISENSNSNVASCEAIFTLTNRDGNKLLLTKKAGIKVNGEEMEPSDQLGRGTIYSQTVEGGQGKYVFEYTDNKGKRLKNKFIVNRNAFLEVPDTIRINDVIKLPRQWGELKFNMANLAFLNADDAELGTISLMNILHNEITFENLKHIHTGDIGVAYRFSTSYSLQKVTDVGGEPINYDYYYWKQVYWINE